MESPDRVQFKKFISWVSFASICATVFVYSVWLAILGYSIAVVVAAIAFGSLIFSSLCAVLYIGNIVSINTAQMIRDGNPPDPNVFKGT